MLDREKVIKQLENDAMATDTGYVEVPLLLFSEILALLKEQEAVEPKQVGLHGKEDWYGPVCVCPDCKAEWMSADADIHFCPKCGRAVKWE